MSTVLTWGTFPAIAVVALLTVAIPAIGDEVLLQDDFNDNSLDPAKWWVNDDYASSVQEYDQRIELFGRAYLNTVEEWDPTDYAGGIKVEMQFTFGNSSGTKYTSAMVVTRSDGIASKRPPYGWRQVQNGLWWEMEKERNRIKLYAFKDFDGTESSSLSLLKDWDDEVTIDYSSVWDIEVIDTGGEAIFTATEIANPSNTATVSWDLTGVDLPTVSEGYPQHVTFTNNEGTDYAYVDDVVITALDGGPIRIPGDANLDGKVTDADAAILATHWQQSGASWGEGDFNKDGAVTDADAAILATHWQEGVVEAAAPVPEPATVVLLFIALLLLPLWCRR